MEPFDLITPDLIDSFIEFFYNVKAVQNVECFGKHFSNDLEVWLPHIRTNHLNLTTIIRSKADEEIPQRIFLSVFDNSEKPFASGVDLVDQRHVLMAFVISDFIDSKGGDIPEFTVFEAVIDDPLHGAIDFVP